MRGLALVLAVVAAAPPAGAETLVAARTIRAQAILAPSDIAIAEATVPGALRDPAEAVGLEARIVLYAGRPIRPGDLGPPAIVARNQIITLLYRQGGLTIATEGRALGRGGPGDAIRAMNTASRSTVTGTVTETGAVLVDGSI